MSKPILIYLCHQFGGDPANVLDVEKKVLAMYERHPEAMKDMKISLYSPLHNTGYLYPVTGWEDGMRICLDFLEVCDYMMVFGGMSNSRGCLIEKDWCLDNYKPIIAYDMFMANPNILYQVKNPRPKGDTI